MGEFVYGKRFENPGELIKSVELSSVLARQRLEKMTQGQQNNENWWNVRRGRLTASKFGRVLHCRTDGAMNNIIAETVGARRSLDYHPAIQWGVNHETTALRVYERDSQVQTEPSGFYVDVSGALGGSPDAVIRSSKKLIEIKCPYSLRADGALKTAIESGKFYVKLDRNRQLILNRTNNTQGRNYWHQIQGCMHFTNWSESCDLVVWTPTAYVVVNVKKDPGWATAYMPKLKDIWKRKWAPSIVRDSVPMTILEEETPVLSKTTSSASTIVMVDETDDDEEDFCQSQHVTYKEIV